MLYFLAFLFYYDDYDDKYSSSDGRVRRAIASEVVYLGIIPTSESGETKDSKISFHGFSI